ncbi:helix-turn-helix domain-containing protein [Desulfosporosinus youngiae]|uniref:Putative transcriptional regulator n=1 Tax=Desulfosporosinus youngiae DSM 17734 TaxID=768710 RepID=H5Y2Q6_9FIRM|nr:helix-turn-helix transcriptional regulator [Desulfosporosinus youngiae]EHQ88319.1 putative transcriptional regulator [Desulfosporosinus youngiae DSM 17734]
MELGKYIQKRREEIGLTRKEIAALLGITEDYYKKIEIGLRVPSIRVKAKIAAVLNISLNDMT